MDVACVVFFGARGASDLERRVDAVRLAASEHLVTTALAAGFAPVLAVTPDDQVARALVAVGAEHVAPRTAPFHLGRELSGIVASRGLERVCIAGGGVGALLGVDELVGLRARLLGSDALVVSNNYYSADIVGIAPARALDSIDLPATDNPLPRLLHQQAGLPSYELPRGAPWLFDVDTPTDATILVRHARCPDRVRRIGGWEAEQGARLDAILALMTTPEVELCVAGRVGASVWAYLETQTACRVRMFAEERGMQAAGRDASGRARTVLGYLYGSLGPAGFFAQLAELSQGLILDSRVLFAHLGLRPTAADRFASDVFAAETIADARLAEFTRAAASSPMPVLLGGQSVVGGGLWALADIAWQGAP